MNKGFTLIELLIVIAIIGIISSTVIVSLVDSISKSDDSKTILAINSARPIATRAERLNDSDICKRVVDELKKTADFRNYTGNPSLLIDDILDGTPEKGRIGCFQNGNKWFIVGSILQKNTSANAKHYCTDSRGNIKRRTQYGSSSSTSILTNNECIQ